MAARDGRYLLKDATDRLDSAITGVREKLKAGKPGTDEVDRFRLEFYRDAIQARGGEPDRGERYAMAALRFYTGVQTAFDIPDEPLKRPDVAFAPLVRYLAAARIFRPEVNMSRAGVEARKAQGRPRAREPPPRRGPRFRRELRDRDQAATPAVPASIWTPDPFNHFWAGGGLGVASGGSTSSRRRRGSAKRSLSSKRRGRPSGSPSGGSPSRWRTPTGSRSRRITASGAGTPRSTRRSSGS